MRYYGGLSESGAQKSTTRSVDFTVRTKVRGLEQKVLRLELEHRVLWELVRDSMNLTEADLESRVKAIDARDGMEDGKVTVVPLRCPQCKRVSSSRHWKCLYCGQDFEKYLY